MNSTKPSVPEESDFDMEEDDLSMDGNLGNEDLSIDGNLGDEDLSIDGNLGDESDCESMSQDAGNSAWANAMSNILKTSAKPKNFILSKARKDSDIKDKKSKEIEFVDSTGKVIETQGKSPKSKTYSEKRKEMIERQKRKAEWESMGRVKPDITNKDKERELVKIATRGVVHLFNTVEKHQKTSRDTKKSNKKYKPNVAKGTFMDILKGFSDKDKITKDEPVVKKVKEEETWSILKDDFMMGAEMKDWDKESDSET